jgi:hypothetical protein
VCSSDTAHFSQKLVSQDKPTNLMHANSCPSESFRDMFDELVDVMDDEPPRPANALERSVASSDIGTSTGNAMKSVWQKKGEDLGAMLPVNLREDFGK